MPFRDVQGLGQFARSGAKAVDLIDPTACSHDVEATPRLECSNQNQPTPGALHEHIEHPVHTVIHVNVNCARHVSLHELTCAWPCKGVASFVIQSEIRLCLDYNPGTFSPN